MVGISNQILGTVSRGVGRVLNSIYPYGGSGVRITTIPSLDDNRVYAHNLAYYSNAFRACLLAKTRPLASLPVHVYKRVEGVRKPVESDAGKALESLLRGKWNPYMTGSEGERWSIMTKDTIGEAFIRVQWRDGIPVALWPMSGVPSIESDRSGNPVFRYGGDKFTEEGRYLQNEIIWIKSPILDEDGLHGVSLADLAAKELGLSIDLEEFYQRLLKNGSHFPGWLETDSKLDPADVDDLKQQLSDGQGVVSAGKLRIFDRGLKYHQTNLTMADMSLVDQERWILQQTCRTLSVPPQEVFDLSNATYSNIEQGALNFAQKTLVPECVAIEQALGWVLQCAGSADEYVQLDMNGLLRGSYRERMEGYRTAIMGGFMSPNTALAKEDEPPYEGGDVYFRSSAYIPVDPATGEELAERTASREPGSSGEGGSGTYGDGEANPAAPLACIKEDMDARIDQRFREKGDCRESRDFAAKVLAPYARACLESRITYDMEADIERIARNA